VRLFVCRRLNIQTAAWVVCGARKIAWLRLVYQSVLLCVCVLFSFRHVVNCIKKAKPRSRHAQCIRKFAIPIDITTRLCMVTHRENQTSWYQTSAPIKPIQSSASALCAVIPSDFRSSDRTFVTPTVYVATAQCRPISKLSPPSGGGGRHSNPAFSHAIHAKLFSYSIIRLHLSEICVAKHKMCQLGY